MVKSRRVRTRKSMIERGEGKKNIEIIHFPLKCSGYMNEAKNLFY